MRETGSNWWCACGLLGALLLLGAGACGESGDGDGDGGGTGNRFDLDYQAGPESLLDLRVNASLAFAGGRPVTPSLSSVGVGQARAIVLGNGQQTIRVTLASGASLEEGDRFEVTLEFSRANEGAVIDAGGTLAMACSFYWWHADDSFFSITGEGDVRRNGGGYTATVREAYLEETQLSGTVTFGPVPNEPVAFTPDGGCGSGQSCLSLDPSEYEPFTGFCMPSTNLKSQAQPCGGDCGQELRIAVGSQETCICTAVCGRLESGGGGDPPTCDPAYGCIDI